MRAKARTTTINAKRRALYTQKAAAQAYIRQPEQAKLFAQPIATTLEPLADFYLAESYHQDYARLNPNDPYIRQQALPKIKKTHHHFADQAKAKP